MLINFTWIHIDYSDTWILVLTSWIPASKNFLIRIYLTKWGKKCLKITCLYKFVHLRKHEHCYLHFCKFLGFFERFWRCFFHHQLQTRDMAFHYKNVYDLWSKSPFECKCNAIFSGRVVEPTLLLQRGKEGLFKRVPLFFYFKLQCLKHKKALTIENF